MRKRPSRELGRALSLLPLLTALVSDSTPSSMVTALASLLTGRAVRSTVGMTGEVTLQGRVLPIGGLKQKVLAAHAAGLTTIIFPARNEPDLDEVPLAVREQMQFHPVQSVDEVLALALEPSVLAMVA